MKQPTTHVYRKIIPNGFEISLDRKNYQILYPPQIWKEFPEDYRQNFADSLTYAMTMYLCMNGHGKLIYNFPHPMVEPYIFESMVYSFGETATVGNSKLKVSDLLKDFYNRNLNIDFVGRPRYIRSKPVNKNLKNRAIIPFSFGKDSLLTYALCKEIGVDPYPVFFREPKSPFENRHKRKLADEFFDEFKTEVTFFPLSVGRLRENDGDYWGWDLLFTQYSMLLLPYFFGLRSKYLFWSHEQDCNVYFPNEEGFKVNPVFEQSKRWILTLNHIARGLGSNTIIASIIEPINEIATTYALHHRYPEIAKYQFSCFAEEESQANKRWCGMCDKCVMINIFLLALGIDPKSVGIRENLLTAKKRNLYLLFKGEKSKFWVRGNKQEDLWWEEQLLAFYMAYKNGAKGALIDEFKKSFLKIAKSREKELRAKMFGIHSFDTLTYELKKPLLKIYQEELTSLA